MFVELIKKAQATGSVQPLRDAYAANAGHFLRSLKAHNRPLYDKVALTEPTPAQAFFVYLYPERAKIRNCGCGNPLKFRGLDRGFGQYCSTVCAGKSVSVKENRKKTVQDRWGVDFVLQHPTIISKVQETNLKLYGNVCSAQGEEQTKIRSAQLRENGKETWKKTQQALIERYGVPTLGGLIQTQDACRAAELQRWKNAKLPQLCASLQEFQVECVVPPTSSAANGQWRHSCGSIYSAKAVNAHICQVCHSKARSRPERELLDYARSLSSTIISGTRSVIPPFEIDVYCTQQKVGIELNGVYWHRDGAEVSPLIKKTRLAESQGVKLLHVWDYEWVHKRDIVKSMISNALGKIEVRKNARSLTLDLNVSAKEAAAFCNANHISGYARSKYKLGLRENGLLQCLLLAGTPRFDKVADAEIIRFCSKLGTSVRGGFTKLLKHVPGNTIVSYADRRFYTGESYKQAGFEFSHETPPNYCWARGEVVLPRYRCQKHKLGELLSDFDPSKTEKENMELNGWIKHSDCGSLVFRLNRAMSNTIMQ